jgi:hypothetical protein
MARRGLQNPIQVGRDRENPLAGGAQLHPSNPRLAVSKVEPLRADGKPWELADLHYLIYGGYCGLAPPSFFNGRPSTALS